MTTFDAAAFEEEVVRLSHVLFLYHSQGQELGAIPKERKKPTPQGIEKATDSPKIVETLATSQTIIETYNLRSILCRHLKSVSHDLTDIAKIVATTLTPLSLSSNVHIPIDPWIYAGIALTIFNATVATFCNEHRSPNN